MIENESLLNCENDPEVGVDHLWSRDGSVQCFVFGNYPALKRHSRGTSEAHMNRQVVTD